MSDTQPGVQETAEGTMPSQQAEAPAQDVKAIAEPNASAAQNDSASDSANGEVSIEMQLADAQAKAAEYLDGWQRARADFANYKKRADKEREEVFQIAAADTLKKLLPVIDDFDRAITNVPSEKTEDDVIKGFNLIHRKLMTLLESNNISVINPVGEEFNPQLHEAIGQDDSSEVASGHVTVVLQKGYKHGDRVLRPAIVRVAS